MENLTKKLALFGLLKDFSFIQLSKTRASDVYATIVDGKLLMLEGNLLQLKPDVSAIENSLSRLKNRVHL